MGRSLWERFDSVRSVFAEASEVLGRDLGRLCFDGSAEELRATAVAQPALYVAGYAGWLALRELAGDRLVPVVGAGHSLGEYTALAAAGALTFIDGLRLVAERGRLMHLAGEQVPGTMLAILGLSLDQTEAVCVAARQQAGEAEVVVVANDNAPGQVVISGTPEAVRLAGELARARGARRVVTLATSGAFHSPLMEPATGELARAIVATPLRQTAFPIIANSTAAPVQQPEDIRAELTTQLCARVRWVESVRRLAAYEPDVLIELGPGQVLSGLVRRIEPTLAVLSIANEGGLDSVVSSL